MLERDTSLYRRYLDQFAAQTDEPAELEAQLALLERRRGEVREGLTRAGAAEGR